MEYLKNTHYDAPVLRFGKAFTTLGVALGISAVFQASVGFFLVTRHMIMMGI